MRRLVLGLNMRTRNHPPPAEPRCPTCGYRLAGLPEPRCPECGGRFDPDDPAIFGRRSEQTLWIVLGLAGAVAAFAFLHELRGELAAILGTFDIGFDRWLRHDVTVWVFGGALGVAALGALAVRFIAQERYAKAEHATDRRRLRIVFLATGALLTFITLVALLEILRPELSR